MCPGSGRARSLPPHFLPIWFHFLFQFCFPPCSFFFLLCMKQSLQDFMLKTRAALKNKKTHCLCFFLILIVQSLCHSSCSDGNHQHTFMCTCSADYRWSMHSFKRQSERALFFIFHHHWICGDCCCWGVYESWGDKVWSGCRDQAEAELNL